MAGEGCGAPCWEVNSWVMFVTPLLVVTLELTPMTSLLKVVVEEVETSPHAWCYSSVVCVPWKSWQMKTGCRNPGSSGPPGAENSVVPRWPPQVVRGLAPHLTVSWGLDWVLEMQNAFAYGGWGWPSCRHCRSSGGTCTVCLFALSCLAHRLLLAHPHCQMPQHPPGVSRLMTIFHPHCHCHPSLQTVWQHRTIKCHFPKKNQLFWVWGSLAELWCILQYKLFELNLLITRPISYSFHFLFSL